MVFDFDTIPSKRIGDLITWCARSKKVPLRQMGVEDARDFYSDKPHRMTPWGVQYLIPQENSSDLWVPPMPNECPSQEGYRICGKWIRDLPEFSHNVHIFQSVEHSEALSAFNHNQLTDRNLELAESVSVDPPAPRTTACKITELPTEVLQHIMAYLMPTDCTFQFFPARMVGSTNSVPCVQKIMQGNQAVNGECPCRHHCGLRAQTGKPYTASTHLAIAATCRHLQNEAYSTFYGRNTFVFHITTCMIRPETRITDYIGLVAWSRALPRRRRENHQPGSLDTGLEPLMPLAVSYLKKVLLIPSLPPAPTAKELLQLTTLMARVSASLKQTRLTSLTLDFQQPVKCTKPDKSSVAKVLIIDSLQAEGRKESAGVAVSLRNPEVTRARESNRAQSVWEPLLEMGEEFEKVKELVLSGCFSESLEEGLVDKLAGSGQNRGYYVREIQDTGRASKRRKV